MRRSGRQQGTRPQHADAMDYPVQVAGMLWPAPARVELSRRRGPATAAGWLVLPGLTRPRMLVPVGVPAAARMLVRHGDRPGPRAARAVLAAGVRSGLLERLPVKRLYVQAVPGAPSLERHLAPWLGDGLVIGALLGTPRVNRKPVLQVFDPAGRTVAFVKAAHDDRTRWLVRREAHNLTRVHSLGLRGIEPPQVIHAGAFGALDVLVLGPLASSQQVGRDAAGPPPLAAMAELSRSAGVARTTVADCPLVGRLAQPPVEAPVAQATRLVRVVQEVLARHGADEVDLGAWHGDWAAWNMGWSGGRLQLWDWERYAEGVPLGFDLVHYLAQRVRHDEAQLGAAERTLLSELPGLLPAVGVPVERARLTLHLYLLELAGRFVVPEGAGPGTDHPRASWALDLAERLLSSADTPLGDVGG